jgi:hypothetical protein
LRVKIDSNEEIFSIPERELRLRGKMNLKDNLNLKMENKRNKIK